MDRIELNGEVYIKQSAVEERMSNNKILELLKKPSIEVYEIAEILKEKLGNRLEGGLWLDRDMVDNDIINSREVLLYIALNQYIR